MHELIDMIERYMEAADLEMEHGDYHAPENYIPYKYEDEEDYYEAHDRIVDAVCALRTKIEDKITELKGAANG